MDENQIDKKTTEETKGGYSSIVKVDNLDSKTQAVNVALAQAAAAAEVAGSKARITIFAGLSDALKKLTGDPKRKQMNHNKKKFISHHNSNREGK